MSLCSVIRLRSVYERTSNGGYRYSRVVVCVMLLLKQICFKFSIFFDLKYDDSDPVISHP